MKLWLSCVGLALASNMTFAACHSTLQSCHCRVDKADNHSGECVQLGANKNKFRCRCPGFGLKTGKVHL